MRPFLAILPGVAKSERKVLPSIHLFLGSIPRKGPMDSCNSLHFSCMLSSPSFWDYE